MLVVIGR